MKYISVFFIIIIFCSVCIVPKQSFACDCAMKNTPKEELKNASAVFRGKVIKMENKRSSLFTKSSADPVYVTFSVQRVWKGIDKNKVTIETPTSEASCGYSFQKNQYYVVYASKDKGKLKVYLCSRTVELSNAKEDLRYLGEPIKAETELKKVTKSKNVFSGWGWSSAGILFIVIILSLIFIIRIKRK